MKIIVTVKEAQDNLCWDRLCRMKGIQAWAVNEGLMSEDETFELTIEEAKELGLINKRR